MALPQFNSFKQLSFSHECYHSDDYFPEQLYFSFQLLDVQS